MAIDLCVSVLSAVKKFTIGQYPYKSFEPWTYIHLKKIVQENLVFSYGYNHIQKVHRFAVFAAW